MACVGLPTCGLSMAESERYLPALISKLETLFHDAGADGANTVVRMTGCPNGCARPYVAEIGLVGKAPGRYNVHLGGDGIGTSLNRLWLENQNEEAILAALRPLVAQWVREREDDERFGAYVQRAGLLEAVA